MECYCVARKSQLAMRKLFKLQSSTVISHRFEVCAHILNLIVIGHYMIDLSKSKGLWFSEFLGHVTHLDQLCASENV